jgi:hypothetical protein
MAKDVGDDEIGLRSLEKLIQRERFLITPLETKKLASTSLPSPKN